MALKLDAAQFQPKLDAVQSVFFARSLEEIDAKLYNTKYAELEAFALVPVKTDIHPGTATHTYRQYDGRGIAVITSNYASGSPRADVDGTEFSSKFKSVRNSYGYNVQEIREAQLAGVPLDSMRAETARRVMNETLNRIALTGDAEHNLVGLFNLPNVQNYTVPAGVSTDTEWTDKTPLEILDDMYGMVDQVPTTTSEVERVNTLLLPYARLRLISRLRVGVDSSQTVLQAFKENRPEVEVRGALKLDKAGAGNTMRAMAYRRDPEVLELMLPIAFESFPPQVSGLEWVSENHARIGGVVCRYPMAVIYADNI
jgi:hypothetical protein